MYGEKAYGTIRTYCPGNGYENDQRPCNFCDGLGGILELTGVYQVPLVITSLKITGGSNDVISSSRPCYICGSSGSYWGIKCTVRYEDSETPIMDAEIQTKSMCPVHSNERALFEYVKEKKGWSTYVTWGIAAPATVRVREICNVCRRDWY